MLGIVAFLVIILVGQVLPVFFIPFNLDFSNVFVLLGLYFFIFGVYFAIFIIFSKIKAGKESSYKQALAVYNFKKPRVMDSLIVVVLGFVSIAAFMLLQNGVIQFLSILGHTANDPGFEMANIGQFFVVVVAVAVLPSIVEELMFRGLILHSLMPFGKGIAVFASSLLFSLFHLNPAQTVYQFFFGVVLALVYLRTKNMLYPMLLHFVNNFTVITYTYITQGMKVCIRFDWQYVLTMWMLVVIGTVIAISLVKILKKSDREPRAGDQKFVGTKEFIGLLVSVVICLAIWMFVFLH